MATYKNPSSLPQYINENNLLWIVIEAYKIKKQLTGIGGGKIITEGGVIDTFKFLAPLSIAETHTHNWEEYESMGSKMAGTMISLAKAGISIREATGAGKAAFEKLKKAYNNKDTDGGLPKRIFEIVNAGLTGASTEYPYHKIDNPVVYTSSSRREINLEFQLVTEHYSPHHTIMRPIRKLQKYAAPQAGATNDIQIKPPYIFKVYSTGASTSTGYLPVNLDWSALVSIQPTFKSPYIDGAPTSAELILQFKELMPFYSETSDGPDRVTVGPGNPADR